MDDFVTFTCNQHDHFGMKHLRQQKNQCDFAYFRQRLGHSANHEINELTKVLEQASAGILLRDWMEVCLLFLDYICNLTTC